MSRATGWVMGGIGVAVVVAATAGAAAWWAARSDALPPLSAAGGDDKGKPKPPGFAEDKAPPPPAPVAEVKFDGDRAMGYLKALCQIGPRVSGTDGMAKQQAVVEKHFTALGATVTRQAFNARQASRKGETPMVNLVVTWNPDAAKRVVLCTHYDTRPIADQEEKRTNWTRPFVSANDGTAGVALLMELGHHMKGLRSEYGVDFVLFDGEEFVFETDRFGGGDRYFIGSDHFAAEYTKAGAGRKFTYAAGILMDMVAAKDARIRVETYSYNAARPLVEQLWGTAADIGAKSFVYERGFDRDGRQGVQDDHLALIRAGIPSVDLIDFDYPHWHKLSDTPEQCSGAQMAEVSKVLTTWLQRVK